MALIAQGTPLFKSDGHRFEDVGRTEKSLRVTPINFKPFDLFIEFDLDGVRHRVDREFVTDLPARENQDETVARGAVGASGGTAHTESEK